MLQAQKGCCLVGPLCNSQDLGFEDRWSAQGGELYEQRVVMGKTLLFWKKIVILQIAMPQGCLAIGAATNENKRTPTAA